MKRAVSGFVLGHSCILGNSTVGCIWKLFLLDAVVAGVNSCWQLVRVTRGIVGPGRTWCVSHVFVLFLSVGCVRECESDRKVSREGKDV